MTRHRRLSKLPIPNHVDAEWISERIGGHGGAYRYTTPESLALITYIGSTPKIMILRYNLWLIHRYIKRKLRRKDGRKQG